MSEAVFVEVKPMEGREVAATPGAVIGREGTDIVVADPEVSRRHAAIRERDGGIAIEDLGSTNGTYVNDRKVQGTQPLSDGDSVRLGNTVWRLRAPTAAPEPGAGATRIGDVPIAAPEVTAARPIPQEPQPAAPQPAAAAPAPPPQAPAPPPQAPAQPAAPSAAPVGRRGDVEEPPDVAPSAIRRVLPPPTQGQAPVFNPPGQRQPTPKGGSAATRVEATIVCMLIVLATAVAVGVYLASQS